MKVFTVAFGGATCVWTAACSVTEVRLRDYVPASSIGLRRRPATNLVSSHLI